jgi:hypothetical protein
MLQKMSQRQYFIPLLAICTQGRYKQRFRLYTYSDSKDKWPEDLGREKIEKK